MKRANSNNNNVLYQKKNHDKWAILGPKMAHPNKSGSVRRIFLKFCRLKGGNRFMKILLVVFREKNSFGAVFTV